MQSKKRIPRDFVSVHAHIMEYYNDRVKSFKETLDYFDSKFVLIFEYI